MKDSCEGEGPFAMLHLDGCTRAKGTFVNKELAFAWLNKVREIVGQAPTVNECLNEAHFQDLSVEKRGFVAHWMGDCLDYIERASRGEGFLVPSIVVACNSCCIEIGRHLGIEVPLPGAEQSGEEGSGDEEI
ncbi:MAG: hypothetical protein ACO326_08240 [Burkholderiaceae bacterium]